MLTDLYNASQDQRVPPPVARTFAADQTDLWGPRLYPSTFASGTHRTSPSQLSRRCNVARFYHGDGRRLEIRNDALPLPLPLLSRCGERQRWRISRLLSSVDDCTDDCTWRLPVLTRLVIWVSQLEDSFLLGDRRTRRPVGLGRWGSVGLVAASWRARGLVGARGGWSRTIDTSIESVEARLSLLAPRGEDHTRLG